MLAIRTSSFFFYLLAALNFIAAAGAMKFCSGLTCDADSFSEDYSKSINLLTIEKSADFAMMLDLAEESLKAIAALPFVIDQPQEPIDLKSLYQSVENHYEQRTIVNIEGLSTSKVKKAEALVREFEKFSSQSKK